MTAGLIPDENGFALVRSPVRCLEIACAATARAEMERMGLDPAAARAAALRQLHYNVMAGVLSPSQAAALSQEMRSLGGDAVVATAAEPGPPGRLGAVVSGTAHQFSALIERLKAHSAGLARVAASIEEAIGNRALAAFQVRGAGRSFEAGGRTLIMGVLNVTPDSFSDGGEFLGAGAAVARGLQMAADGADWIDVGGESTRPGSSPVGPDEEMRRVLPVVEELSGRGLAVSIDTTKAAVAEAALAAGASMVNDISALSMDERMAEVVASSGSAVVLMHMRGTPATMQLDTSYRDLLGEVCGWLQERVEYAEARGISRQSVIVDPGLCFGKSAEGNMELLARLRELGFLGRPVLVGPSRKSFIGKALGGAPADGRLPGTLAACAAAVLGGASMLRVHDVKEARQAAAIADAVARYRVYA